MCARASYDKQLEDLQREILRMGSLVESAVDQAVHSLVRQDLKLAEAVIKGDDSVNVIRRGIEESCLVLIATQQPIAKDLRRIIAAISIVTDLERMGDHAAAIAKVTKRLANQPLIKPLIDIPKMARLAQAMVRNVLDSYVKGDVDMALQTCQADDEIDHLYKAVFDELVEIMINDRTTINQATYLLFVARYLERIADHATNIGENVIYLETGERKELNL
ncbi:MAG TPA: phosphate signaling complex protein PhoU [Bacillota bacterium]|nr:phosphate signaling complex protein PhoU [Bacillota bacterium]